MEWIPAGRSTRPVPSDWCSLLRHSLVMPARMMGKLTIEEWRPLIASSVLFQKKLRRSVDRRWWLYILLPTLLVLVGSTAVDVILRIYWISLIILLMVFPVIIVGNRHYGPYLKKARLDA